MILSNYKALREVPERPREVGDCLGGWESRLGPCRGVESRVAPIRTASADLTRLLKVTVHGMARNDMCKAMTRALWGRILVRRPGLEARVKG